MTSFSILKKTPANPIQKHGRLLLSDGSNDGRWQNPCRGATIADVLSTTVCQPVERRRFPLPSIDRQQAVAGLLERPYWVRPFFPTTIDDPDVPGSTRPVGLRRLCVSAQQAGDSALTQSLTASTSLPKLSPENSLSSVSGNVSKPSTISSRCLRSPAAIHCAICCAASP